MKVSVVIATYRRAQSLARTLATIAAQTRLPEEVIVVDQSPSAEKTAVSDVVAAAGQTGLAVRLMYCAEPSSTRARNLGLAAATGGWVVFSDDDVDWPPVVLAAFIAKVTGAPELALVAARDISVPQRPRPLWRRIVAALFLTDVWGPLRRGQVFACMQARYPQPVSGDMETEWAMGYWFAVDRHFTLRHGLAFDEKLVRYAQAEDMLFSHQFCLKAKQAGRRCVVSEGVAVAHLVSQEWREPDAFADLCGAWNRIYAASLLRPGAAFWASLLAIYWAAVLQTFVRMVGGRGWVGHLRAYVVALRHLPAIRAGELGKLYARHESRS